MNNVTINHTGTDQNWQDETTIHWFEVTGQPYGFNRELDGTYGWADNNGHISILDSDGYPLTDGDGETEAVRQALQAKATELTESPQ